MKTVKQMIISIEWKKSRMYGSNPNLSAKIQFSDGEWKTSKIYRCSGYGYDKESTVIAQLFNDYLNAELQEKIEEIKVKTAPYGVREYQGKVSFMGGVGTSCYYKISEFIGGKFEYLAGGNSFDCFIFKKIEVTK